MGIFGSFASKISQGKGKQGGSLSNQSGSASIVSIYTYIYEQELLVKVWVKKDVFFWGPLSQLNSTQVTKSHLEIRDGSEKKLGFL